MKNTHKELHKPEDFERNDVLNREEHCLMLYPLKA